MLNQMFQILFFFSFNSNVSFHIFNSSLNNCQTDDIKMKLQLEHWRSKIDSIILSGENNFNFVSI